MTNTAKFARQFCLVMAGLFVFAAMTLPHPASAQQRMNYAVEGSVFGKACYQYLHNQPERLTLSSAGYGVKKQKRRSTIYLKEVGKRGKFGRSEITLGFNRSKTRFCRFSLLFAPTQSAHAAVNGIVTQFEAGGYATRVGSGVWGQGDTFFKSKSATFKAYSSYSEQGGVLSVIVSREK